MTAVASPIQFQPPSRPGWNSISGGQNGLANMSSEDMSRMFMPGPRKTAQRTNSSSSISSSASSSSTVSASASQTSNITAPSSDSWATRKKPSRGIWPAGKSEPTAGISTARPQAVSTASSGQSAASGLSAMHAPLLPSQQLSGGQTQQNGTLRNGNQAEAPALLYLLPMNGTFERKTINVPYYPDVLRIGRQTNAKTAPTPSNGFFDSKVLSRQHAEVYAERNGRIFIRDVKSSNGTFVNGKRLSPENKESEPHELREQDVLELGIDIVSEDQKTVVHHKVAARVEHAGVYTSSGDINFADLDPSSGGGFVSAQQMKRTNSQNSAQGAKANAMAAAAMAANNNNGMQQQQGWSRLWLQPISTEHIVKRLNRELTLARQQSQDIARAKQFIDGLPDGETKPVDQEEKKPADKELKTSPPKSKLEPEPQFTKPPAPPPQQPLPEKPDVVKVLADPMIQPLLQRSDTARPFSLGSSSPTRSDHSHTLLILTHELKLAKDQIPSLEERVKKLETQLLAERSARETAEERAQQLELGSRKDSVEPSAMNGTINGASEASVVNDDVQPGNTEESAPSPDLVGQIERLRASMDDMKQQMEAYRQRAESAESERDETRQTLAQLVEQKREENADEYNSRRPRSKSPVTTTSTHNETEAPVANGSTVVPKARSIHGIDELLEKAGVDVAKPLTKQQAIALQALLSREVLGPSSQEETVQWNKLSYHGVPHAAALTTVMLGLALMHYLNGWEKIQR